MISIRIALASAGAIFLFACGWYARGKEIQIIDRPITQIVTKTDTVVKTQVVDHVVTKVIRVVVKDPDDPSKTTETVTTTTDDTHTTAQKTDVVDSTVSGVAASRSNYSVGLKWQPDWRDRTWSPSGADVGYRVIAGAWVTAGYDWKNKAPTVGVRVDF